VVVPLVARDIAAGVGVLLVATAAASIIGTLIVPRPIGSWLTRLVDRIVNAAFRMGTARIADYRRRDRVLAAQAAAILLGQLAAWLALFFVGYALLLWPFTADLTTAFTTAGPALWEIGSATVHGAAERAIQDIASLSGIMTVTLQIAYLPTLYSAFNRRETEVALLNARAGVPSWGPELLARTHYALGSGASTIDTLPDLYAQWERWAADVAESHATYLAPDAVPLPEAPLVLGDRPARRAGLRRALPRSVPAIRARRARPAVPALRIPVLQRGRDRDEHQPPRGS
jgi:hypothetical protein